MGPWTVLAAISLESIWERLLTAAIVAGITAVVTLFVLRAQFKGLLDKVKDLGKVQADHAKQLAKLRTERTQCELRATHEFATKGDWCRVQGQVTEQYHRILDGLDSMHGRISLLGEKVAKVEGQQEAAQGDPS